MNQVAFLGVGSFLPEEVRKNDWWPDEVIRKWTQTCIDNRQRVEDALGSALSEGQRAVLKAMLEVHSDPFRGGLERRVMPAGMDASGMEVEAARNALKAAGILADDVDVLITHSMVPDDIGIPNAFVVHDKLGLSDRCLTTTVDGACNSFLMQVMLAENLVSSGRARHVLLVQSSSLSRVLDYAHPQSVWFGDGATAVVLGASQGVGRILGRSTMTDSRLRNAVATGIPGRKWYEGGERLRVMSPDPKAGYQMQLSFADYAKRVVDGSLSDAGLRTSDVSFFACHQAQVWHRRVAQQFCGLDEARALDTFKWAGNLSSANIPLVLEIAQREGVLRNGDLVAMYGGGAGVSVSGLIVKWGG